MTNLDHRIGEELPKGYEITSVSVDHTDDEVVFRIDASNGTPKEDIKSVTKQRIMHFRRGKMTNEQMVDLQIETMQHDIENDLIEW